jgi:hypothetical protein
MFVFLSANHFRFSLNTVAALEATYVDDKCTFVFLSFGLKISYGLSPCTKLFYLHQSTLFTLVNLLRQPVDCQPTGGQQLRLNFELLTRVKSFIVNSPNFCQLQSVYHSLHSTESTFVRVMDVILCKIDLGSVVSLASLEVSAAFDTICHKSALQR